MHPALFFALWIIVVGLAAVVYHMIMDKLLDLLYYSRNWNWLHFPALAMSIIFGLAMLAAVVIYTWGYL